MTNSNSAHEASSIGVLAALRQGGRDAKQYKGIIIIFWGGSLLLALLAALPFRSLLIAEAGQSLIVNDLVKGFDYTFLNDFMQNYGSGFTPILQQSILLLAVQYLLLVFLVGGMVKVLFTQPVQNYRTVFWSGAGRYFWRYLRLSLFFLLVHVLIVVFFGWLYLQVTHGLSPKALDSEGVITTTFRWLIPLYILVAALPFMWQDYAKVLLVKNDDRFIWPSVGQALRLLVNNFTKTYLLYLLNIGLVILVLGLNYILTGSWEVSSFTGVLFSFLGSQIFVVVRYLLKVVNQGSVVAMEKGLSFRQP